MGSVLIKGVEISPQPGSELSDRVVGVDNNSENLSGSGGVVDFPVKATN